MEIKCPKCKYRFEEDIQSYETEHSCVCPRCGTPFMYSAHAEAESGGVQDEGATHQDSRQETAAPSHDEAQASPVSDKSASAEQPEAYSARTSLELRSRDYRFGESPYHRRSHRRQRLRRQRLMLAAVAVVLFIIGISYIANKVSTDPNAAAFENASYSDYGKENEVDSLSELFNDTEEGEAEPAPQWIQGRWVAHTDLYDIEIEISGNNITETEGGKSCAGTFMCKNQKLVCTYGENNIFIYRLDANARTIDCGDGIIMRKVR